MIVMCLQVKLVTTFNILFKKTILMLIFKVNLSYFYL